MAILQIGSGKVADFTVLALCETGHANRDLH